MKLYQVLPCLSAALLLCACATDGASRTSVVADGRLEHIMAQADTAAKSGQREQAMALLHSAAAAYPGDKAPWVQMAQLRFDHASYGEAISHGLAALERDPDDRAANNLVAISAVRVGARSLNDLTRQSTLNGPLRNEALELARLLRASVSEEARRVQPPAVRRTILPAVVVKPVTPAPTSSAPDPFYGLK